MNVLFGLCGLGSRFANAGYDIPKYLIEYGGTTMIAHAVNTLGISGKIHFIVKEEHLLHYPFIEKMLLSLGDNIIVCKKQTQGAAETLLLAKPFLNLSLPMISANCDQYLEWDPKLFKNTLVTNPNTSYVVTYTENSTKCSYVREADGQIVEVREKKVISNMATVGIYHWAKTLDFMQDAESMIELGIKEHGEYYVAPVYNYTIARQKLVKSYKINNSEFYPVGTPDDLAIFKQSKGLS